jgi:hypothetical protein
MYIPIYVDEFGEEKKKIDEKRLEYKAVKKNHKLMYKKVKWFDGLKKSK